MASGLRAKLNAIAAAAPRVEAKPPRAGGVACYAHRQALDARLRDLDHDGLRRIGWQGCSFTLEKCLFSIPRLRGSRAVRARWPSWWASATPRETNSWWNST